MEYGEVWVLAWKAWIFRTSSSTDDNSWRLVWGLNGPPKLCHFIWRACHGILGCERMLSPPSHYVSVVMPNPWCCCRVYFPCVIRMRACCGYICGSSGFDLLIAEAPRSSFGEYYTCLASKVSAGELLSMSTLMWLRGHVVINFLWPSCHKSFHVSFWVLQACARVLCVCC